MRRLASLCILVLAGCASAPTAAPPAEPEAPPRTSVRSRPARPASSIDPEEGRDPLTPPSDVAGPIGGAQTDSGIASKRLRPGTGTVHPTASDRVRVVYTGWTRDGEMFDSSTKRGDGSAVFPLRSVIPGWTQGLQTMVEHEKRRFWIPADLAYGEAPERAGVPAGQLTFDIELLEILSDPPTPPDVAAAPPTATVTPSGLAYVVLTPGTGTTHPGPSDDVVAHYTGWTADGKMFDSSVTRGDRFTFKPEQVIKGWSEMVQLMVEGEKVRVWIPGKLAYGDKPRGAQPAGQLTFEIELFGFTRGVAAAPSTKSP